MNLIDYCPNCEQRVWVKFRLMSLSEKFRLVRLTYIYRALL